MSFDKIPYDKQRLEAFRIRLENYGKAGEPISYSVSIDDIDIIPRTEDATLFGSIYELLDSKTQSLCVSEYVGETRNRKTTCFMFTNAQSAQTGTLNGIETNQPVQTIEERVQRQVEHATLKQNYDRTQRENQTLKQQLSVVLDKSDEQEKRIKELEYENEELKNLTDENSQNNILLTLGREALEKWLGTNTKKAEGPLSGTPQNEQQQDQKEQSEQERNEGPTHIAVPENEYNDYKFFSTLIQKFDPVKRGLVSQLVTHLSEHPEQIEEVFMNAFYKNEAHGNEEN